MNAFRKPQETSLLKNTHPSTPPPREVFAPTGLQLEVPGARGRGGQGVRGSWARRLPVLWRGQHFVWTRFLQTLKFTAEKKKNKSQDSCQSAPCKTHLECLIPSSPTWDPPAHAFQDLKGDYS